MVREGIEYEVSYRKIRNPRLEFGSGKLWVIIPPGADPEKIIEKHKDWISKKTNFIGKCLAGSNGKKLAERDEADFRKLVRSLAGQSARKLRVRVNNIYFRRMKSKWASCSRKKNLTINSLMKYLPDHLIEYIIFHETVHLLEKRHSERFWKIISRCFPEHDQIEKELFSYWFSINNNSCF